MRIPHLALILSLSLPAARLAAVTYTVQILAYPGATQTYAQAVNAAGDVVGFYTDDTGTSHGLTWTAGAFTVVDIPDASGTWLTGINKSDVICGYYHKTSGSSSGVTLGFQQTGTKVVSFGLNASTRATFPGGINTAGQISGYDETGSLAAGVFGGFILSAATGGTATTVDVSGQAGTWVGAINSSEDVVGFSGADLDPTTPVSAFEYSASKATFETFNMPNMVQTRFYGINDLGAVVGYAFDSSQVTHSFLFKAGTYETFTIPGYTVAIPQGINNSGVIVGYAVTTENTVVGFVATP
jgi:probable HAF family extracellular repeat protein